MGPIGPLCLLFTNVFVIFLDFGPMDNGIGLNQLVLLPIQNNVYDRRHWVESRVVYGAANIVVCAAFRMVEPVTFMIFKISWGPAQQFRAKKVASSWLPVPLSRPGVLCQTS